MKIVLYQPQIPQNTGNIVRTCACTNTELVLVHPLGFQTDDRSLKRAGLDYWEGVTVTEIKNNFPDWLEAQDAPLYFFSSHAQTCYADTDYHPDSILIFGSETTGLPKEIHERWPTRFFTLPMKPGIRCLNLSSTACAVVYEALRQTDFQTLRS